MRQKFKWQINDYNTYAATNVICQVIGNIFGTYVLNKMLQVPEIIIGVIGYFSAMVEYIICGLANQSWQLYLGKFSNIFDRNIIPLFTDYFFFCWECSIADCITERSCCANVPIVFGGFGAIN